MGFGGRQDPYNAYVEDFTILQIMADGDKVVQFEENPKKAGKVACKIKPEVLPKNTVYRRQ